MRAHVLPLKQLFSPLKTNSRVCEQIMAHSKFAYVRKFEIADPCLPNCWPVVRIDGKNFHKFASAHNFTKPNDDRGLGLMTKAAARVMQLLTDVVIAYGQSDEYSFVFKKTTETYNRRASKLSSVVVSQFSSAFVFHWKEYFEDQELLYPPAFDSRVILYPSYQNVRDYLSWRQADCHINNLYNTCFWCLVGSGQSTHEAHEQLKGTVSGDKNELLFSKYGINYNNLPQLYRKGTVIIANKQKDKSDGAARENVRNVPKNTDDHDNDDDDLLFFNTDIIGKDFWEAYPHLLRDD